MNDAQRRVGLALAVLAILGAVVWIEAPWRPQSSAPAPPEDIPQSALQQPAAADFAGATGWLNGGPLDLKELRGQVVLVDFWTYSCINCINTFPYLNAWHDRYADHGLVIVGVHSPEFRFERNASNVQAAADEYGIEHTVALDNDYSIWRAYHNRYWPAKYLVDQWGRIQYTHFGEGAYAETEAKIRELLVEAGHDPPEYDEPILGRGGGGRVGQTPELYAGAAQGMDRVGIASEEGYHPGMTVRHAWPETIEPDGIYLVGRWFHEDEQVRATAEGNVVIVNFTAGASNVVLEAPAGSCVAVELDGAPITPDVAGRDVSFEGEVPCLPVELARSYDYYQGPFSTHEVLLRVPEGTTVYAFAFSREAR